MTWTKIGELMGEVDELIENQLDYETFMASKKIAVIERGMSNVPKLASHLFQYQRDCVEFALRGGSSGLFLDTGLGKTACELEFCYRAAEASNGRALILTPLAVARQIEDEGKRWGYPIRVIREQSEAGDGINVCNYDRWDRLTVDEFGAVALDESSILKNFSGKTTRALIDGWANHRWRIAATATPAPNDHEEMGNHSEFLGVLPRIDMLTRWFIHDSKNTSEWRLKGHAREHFWDWMASWCRMAEHPRDLGDDIAGFDLPPMQVIRHEADSSDVKGDEGTLFQCRDASATGIHRMKRQTAESRASVVAGILDRTEPHLIWCDTDYEQDAIERIIGMDNLISVRGSQSIEKKESGIAAWINGDKPWMLSKAAIMGFGMNFQFCPNQIFAGRSFSYESWYQAVRRSWRFGQKKNVKIHLVVAEGEDSIGRVIDRKSEDHIQMKRELTAAMKRAMGKESIVRRAYEPTFKGRIPSWLKG